MQHSPVTVVLSGLDPTGGAGILADIRALAAAGVRIAPLITANTLQGGNKPAKYVPTDAAFLSEQLTLVSDLFAPEALKIGMIGSADNADVIKHFLNRSNLPAVLDPVMNASSGGLLIDNHIRKAILDTARKITLLTPNRYELEWLADWQIISRDDVSKCISILLKKGFANVLVKGGHFSGNPEDQFYQDGQLFRSFSADRYTQVVRGTGCHLASYAAAMLAKKRSVDGAVISAYNYVQSMLLNYGEAGKGILPADSPDTI
jgi:hydroxymethylpyrimidine/phosphomethylpyrimidine kinase